MIIWTSLNNVVFTLYRANSHDNASNQLTTQVFSHHITIYIPLDRILRHLQRIILNFVHIHSRFVFVIIIMH